MSWEIQILFRGNWTTVATGFASRGDAEWATAGWKQQNQCYGDPFRAVQQAPCDEMLTTLATPQG